MRSFAFPSRTLLAAALAVALALLMAARGRADRESETEFVADVVAFAAEHFAINLWADEDLASSAREYSEILATGANVDTHEFLRQSLSHHGVMDPFPYVFYGSGPASELQEIQRRLLQHLSQLPSIERRLYTHIGVGIHVKTQRRLLLKHEKWFVTVLLTQRAVSYSALPETLQPGGRFLFEGELHPPFREPEILLTRPDGTTEVLANFADDPLQFRTYVRLLEQYGEYQLEVMGRYDLGPRVLGLCSLFLPEPDQIPQDRRLLQAARSGTLKPSRARPPRTQPSTEREAELVVLRLLNRDRVEAGLHKLEEVPGLSALARAHSYDMRDHHFFAHVSPQTGHLAERAENAGIPYRRLGENIALGLDVQEAQQALMRSPGHRMNLLDPDFTHVGVGVAFDVDLQGNRRVFVTQNFMVPENGAVQSRRTSMAP